MPVGETHGGGVSSWYSVYIEHTGPLGRGSNRVNLSACRRDWPALFIFLGLQICLPVGVWLMGWTAFAGPNVLLLWDDSNDSVTHHPPEVTELNPNTQALVSALEAAGIAVTFSVRSQDLYTGFNPAPGGFDVVIHLNGNADVFAVMTPGGATVLRDYVNAGGAYIGSENTALQLELPFVGLSSVMTDLMPIDRVGGRPKQTVTLSKVADQAMHPVIADLPASFSITASRLTGSVREYATQPATVLMTDELGSPAVVVREFGQGRVVAFHHAGNFDDAPTLADPKVQRLYVNAVYWADRKPPSLVELTPLNSRPVRRAAVFTATFSEGVVGVSANAFAVEATADVAANASIGVFSVSDRKYLITVQNLQGNGVLRLRFNGPGAITDQSVSQNPLAIATLLSAPVQVDNTAPGLDSFAVTPTLPAVGSQPVFTFGFSESMDSTRAPRVIVETANGGTIPGRAGFYEAIALYTFTESSGTVVHDVSGNGTPLDLTIANVDAVTWTGTGLRLQNPTIIQSAVPAEKVVEAVSATGEFCLEAWIQPDNAGQTGPARIVTISADNNARNVSLLQNEDNYEVRFRTTTTSLNGIPSLSSPDNTVAAALQHVVYTRGNDNRARLYVNGRQVSESTVSGLPANWDSTFHLALGNELTLGRPWRGVFRRVALYARALSAAEIEELFQQGPGGVSLGDGQWVDAWTYRVTVERPVSESDRGPATVRIENVTDSAGNAAIVQPAQVVLGGSDLRFTRDLPVFVYAEVGGTLRLEVTVTGAVGTPSYQWYHEAEGSAAVPIGENSPILTRAPVQFSDAGRYYCVVSDDLTSLQSSKSRVYVVTALPAATGVATWLILCALLTLGAWGTSRAASRPCSRC